MKDIEYTKRKISDGSIVKIYHSNKPERLEEETFVEYKLRRAAMKAYLKSIKSRKIWNSKIQGTLNQANFKQFVNNIENGK